MEQNVVAWLLFALFCFVVEVGNPGLFLFLSFAVGAVAAAGSVALAWHLSAQLVVAFVVTVLSFFVMRSWLSRRLGLAARVSHATNVDALIGRSGVVTATLVHQGVGVVRLDGQLWSAKEVHHQEVRQGARVIVVAVRGVHLIVQSAQN